jgi:hypothetical protein
LSQQTSHLSRNICAGSQRGVVEPSTISPQEQDLAATRH